MLAKRIIPCLDVKDGRVVKGVSFVNLRDAGDPVENAKFYDQQGADELIFLDITASHEKRKIILDVVERTAEDVFMPLTVGGGIKSLDDIRDLLNAGCDKVSINTTTVKDPYFVSRAAEKFGSQCIVVAIDAKRVTDTMADATAEDWFDQPSLKNVRLDLPAKGLTWAISTHGGRKMKLIDAIVAEPLGGAHRDPVAAVAAVGEAIEAALLPLLPLDGASLKARRREKFLEMGREVLL